jgi:gingipain R
MITGYSDKPVGMIIVSDTTFKENLQPFIRWKTQKGFRLTVLYAGEIGSTYTEIRNAIAIEYNSLKAAGNLPEYLLIIGDVSKVPYYGTGNVSDMYYGELDGEGDYIPDMFIGRILRPILRK